MDVDQVEITLKNVGLLGAGIPHMPGAWRVGDAFLQSITFMGCSPFIELEPGDAGQTDFCHIRIHRYSAPRLMYGRLTGSPKCPQCRKALSETPEQLARVVEDNSDSILTCLHCDKEYSPEQAGWRRDAGIAQLFVEITNVFPGEAVPVDALMQGLSRLPTGTWTYCYILR